MPYDRQIPDAPIAGSMLPRATEFHDNDILVLIQPNNQIGQRNKSTTLGDLMRSESLRYDGVRNAIIKSNILDYSGALASTRTVNAYTEICHLDIDPRLDAVFHVWGSSNIAVESTYENYDYGFRAMVRQYYYYDDVSRDLVAMYHAGVQIGSGVGVKTPVYNASFGCMPFNYYTSPEWLEAHPTKRVTLFLATGSSMNPYQAQDPTSFDLKIQATIFPSTYNSTILKATETP